RARVHRRCSCAAARIMRNNPERNRSFKITQRSLEFECWHAPQRAQGKTPPAFDLVQGRTRHRKGEAPPWCLDAELSATLDVKRLAAAALVLDVRVVELEPFVEPFPCEVELGAVEIRQALRIDHDGDAMAFEAMILGTNIVDVLELIGKPVAAGGALDQSQRADLPALA